MTINPSTLASAVGSSVTNTNFKAGGTDIPRKVLVVGFVDPTLETTLTEYVPIPVTDYADARAKFGRGFQLSKRIEWLNAQYKGITYAMPVFEGTATQSTGTVTFAGTTTKSAELHMYIGTEKVASIVIPSGSDGEHQNEAVVAAMALMPDLPVTGAKDGVTPAKLNVESKSGATGWDFTISFNKGLNEVYPAGMTAPVVVQMTGGAGAISWATVLPYLGVEDLQNETHFTSILLPITTDDETNLDALSEWNGVGNDLVGNYAKLIGKPVISVIGNTEADLATMIKLGEDKAETDRTNIIICVPGSVSHPMEIGAKALGYMETLASGATAYTGAPYTGGILTGIFPGEGTDNWANSHTNRDLAKANGISSCEVVGSAVKIADVVTLYHSAAIPVASNGYREACNIPILQNILNDVRTNFKSEKWLHCSVVADKAKVSNVVARQKARSMNDVMIDLVSLVRSWEAKSWIWSADWTIAKLKEGGYVQLRDLGNGFDVVLPLLLRAIPNVMDTNIQFDASVSIAL